MRTALLFAAALAAFAAAPTAPRAAGQNAEQLIDKLTPAAEQPRTRSFGRGVSVEGGEPPATSPSVDIKVPFAFDSAELGTDAQLILRQLGRALADPRLSDFSFRIVGHTDAKGTANYNAELSRRRAESVADYLVFHHGVTRRRLSIQGMGERELADPGRPQAAVNRRVEVVNTGRPETVETEGPR